VSGEPAWPPFRSWTPLIDPRTIPRGPVLCFAPHPDDEVIGCGGALAFHVARGDPVHVVHLTGGEAGDPDAREGGDLVAVRMREARAAAAVLGIGELRGLGFPDGKLVPSEAVIETLIAEVDRVAPAVAYAPSPLEFHPDHLATGAAAAAALARAAPGVRLFLFEVNHPTLASFLLDITPFIDRKREALAKFESQQRYNDLIGKFLGLAYSRTVNIAIPGIEYVEAFLEVEPARLPELWADLAALHRRHGLP
jgi:LmbE family N-acetylglucosaminyl deacetylase